MTLPPGVTVLTDPSGFAANWPHAQHDLRHTRLEDIAGARLVVICSDDITNNKPAAILNWKRDGHLPDTRLLFGTYKGLLYWSKDNDDLANWVIHTNSERQRIDSDRLHCIPLALTPLRDPPPPDPNRHVFIGGRKMRKHQVALDAVMQDGLRAVFVGDPHGMRLGGQVVVVPECDLRHYQSLIAQSSMVLVPLEVNPASHGHLDVVRALLLGRPVIATRGGSCDDYIDQGANGFLVNNTPEAFAAAIEVTYHNLDRMSVAAGVSGKRHTFKAYNRHLLALVNEALKRRAIANA